MADRLERAGVTRLTYDEAGQIAEWLHPRMQGIVGKGDVEGLTDLVQTVMRKSREVVAAREEGQ